MDAKRYNRLLIQLLLLPLAALSLLAIVLGYSFERVQKSANWVDHSDQVIAHANRLMQLMVDEETAVRGYLLNRDPVFLQPYQSAERILPQEFGSTFSLLADNPDQTARLKRLQQTYTQWQQSTSQALTVPNSMADARLRKQQMDQMRSEAQGFLQAEEALRQQRAITATDVGLRARWLLVALIFLAAVSITWITLRSFSRLRSAYARQLQESDKQKDLAAQNAQWLGTTLRSIGDGVIVCDPEGNIALMNPVAERLTGWNESLAKGLPLPQVFHIIAEHTRAVSENPVDKVRRTGDVVSLANHTILIRKNGEEIGIDDSAAPIRNREGKMIGIVLVFRDCTDRRNSQTALMRAEKLAAAGKLAASIAHEVNNPLEGLTNMLYLASESIDLAEIRQWLAQAQSEVGRLSHITRQTLGFYRESAHPAEYSPANVAEEVLSFYLPKAQSKNVELQSQIRTRRLTYGTAGELKQVLSNLISNSLDAMPNGGVVRVAVREVTDLKDPRIQGVRISVADNGCGIPTHILNHVFEPFFTTKHETGTGLGLWVSKELVAKHGGTLRVRSSIAGSRTGTVFSIYIPVRAGASAEESGSPQTGSTPA